MVIVGVALRDASALAFSALVLAGILFLRMRSGIAGIVMLAVVLVDSVAFMAPAALSNIVNREDVVAVMIPASVAVISLTGAVAAVASVLKGHEQSSGRVAALIPQAALAVLALSAIAAGVRQQDAATQAARPGDVMIEVGSLTYEPSVASAENGEIAIAARNTDLFWHTVTIDELDVDLSTPVRATRRVTFRAQPGEYRIYCRVPGHAAAGMEGTLRIT